MSSAGIRLIALSFLLVLVPRPAWGQDATSLCVRLEPGMVLRYRMTMDMTQNSKFGEMEVSGGGETISDFSYRVLERLKDGSFLIDVRYGAIRGKLTLPSGEVPFDSTKPASGNEDLPPGVSVRHLTALAGKGFRLRLDPRGQVLGVEGAEDMLKGMFNDLDPAMAAVMKLMISDERLLEMMQAQFHQFPTDPAQIGTSWQTKYNMPMGDRRMAVEVRNVLEELAGEEAEISQEGTIGLAGAPAEERPAGKEAGEGEDEIEESVRKALGKAQIEEGTVKGTSRICLKDGLPVSMSARAVVTMRMQMPFEGAQMVMKTTQATKIERLPSEPAAEEKEKR